MINGPAGCIERRRTVRRVGQGGGVCRRGTVLVVMESGGGESRCHITGIMIYGEP